MSSEYVLPMSLESSVTYVPGWFIRLRERCDGERTCVKLKGPTRTKARDRPLPVGVQRQERSVVDADERAALVQNLFRLQCCDSREDHHGNL